MLIERFQDRKNFEFVDLINPKRFRTWEGKVPSNKIDLLEQRYGPLFDMPMLQSQLVFLYRVKISIKKIAWNY